MPTTAILGGGLSGLSLAYYLAKACPADKILLIEKSKRLGGWIQSVSTPEGISFESGPRSIRPVGLSGLLTLDLIDSLGLKDSLRTVSKSHPSARNRFIYYNGKLNKAPNSLVSAITQSIDKHSPFHGLLGRVLKEPFQPVSQDVDESLHDFISRRFGTAFAEKVMSALIHGIYAGDTRKLSVAAVFPSMWRMEKLRGSIVKSLLLGGLPVDPAEAKDRAGLMTKLGDLAKSMRKVSVYTLDGGLQLLPDTLEKALRRESSVEIRQGAELQAVTKTHDGISLRIEDKDVSVNRMVSAISSSGLQKLLPYDELSHNPSVTVGVVNLAFTADYRLPVTGFGYLIPRSVDPTQNPHQALGVVFDSDMFDSPGQPTRLTVMLGGHYWDGRTSVPSEDELLEAALDTLVRHGIIPSGLAPVASRVSIQRDCIPQYAIGHVQRMRRLHTRLRDDFDGRLAVLERGTADSTEPVVYGSRAVRIRMNALQGELGMVYGDQLLPEPARLLEFRCFRGT